MKIDIFIKYLCVFLLISLGLVFSFKNEAKTKNKICEFEYEGQDSSINPSAKYKYEGQCSKLGEKIRNGWGKDIAITNDEYNGTIIYSYYSNDFIHGPSKAVYPCPGKWCGHEYVTLYKKGTKYWSKLNFSGGNYMIGEALDSIDQHRIEGWGKLYFANGENYAGQFSNNYRNGLGINVWKNGKIAEGVWLDDKFEKSEEVNLDYLNNLLKKYDSDIKFGESLDDKFIEKLINNHLEYVAPDERTNKNQVSEKVSPEEKPQIKAPKKEKKPLKEKKEKAVIEEPKVTPSPNDLIHYGSGTGFFINKEGYLITNQHVVDFCDVIEVKHNDMLKKTLVIASNKKDDLAIIRVENVKPKYFFYFSNKGVDIMDNIHIAGFPFGLYSSSVKTKSGTVSSLTGMNNDYSIMEIDAPVSNGNSGGPVISVDTGGVVGIVVGKFPTDTTGEFEADDINFAIKASIAKEFLQSNDIRFHVKKNTSFVKEDLRKTIKAATVYVSCSITKSTLTKKKKEQDKLSTKEKTFFKGLLNE